MGEAAVPAQSMPARRWLVRFAPVLSLCVGVAAAVWMEPTPRRAVLVALGASAGWLAIVVMLVLRRVDPARHAGMRRMLLRGARYSAGALSVSLIQQSLFFSIPFYFHAGHRSPGQIAFLALLAAVALLTLWDPLIERVLTHPVGALAVQGLSTFAGLNAVLPAFGLSNRAGLFASAGVAALGLPVLAALDPDRRGILRAALLALVLPALLLLEPVRAAIPPAPLRLSSAAIGTRMEGRELADPSATLEAVPLSLICATSVAAPRGLRDALQHVWRHDGAIVDSVPVEVRGGREEGYRTWSEKKKLGPDASGVWSCTVETASGQELGATSVRVNPPKN